MAPRLCSTLELTLLVGVEASWTCRPESRTAATTSPWYEQNGKGKEDMMFLPLVTYDRWNSMRREELALTLTKYTIQRAGPALCLGSKLELVLVV